MIQPTVGRIVLYHSSEFDHQGPGGMSGRVGQEFPAIVSYVHGPRMVNLAVFDSNGVQCARASINLHQPEDTPVVNGLRWCEWMPYQQKKATGSESGEKAAGSQAI